MHDTIGCYLDLDNGHVSYSKNGAVLTSLTSYDSKYTDNLGILELG